MAYLYGLFYLVVSTFPPLWQGIYHQSTGIGGLNYISIAVGCTLGSQIFAPLNDPIYRYLKRTIKTDPGVGRPEFRVLLIIAMSPSVPVGMFIYGFTAAHHTHWIWPNIGACIFSAGIIVGFQCIQTYLVDAYPRFAASATGAVTVLRSLAGFGFPIFAPAMYNS
jgi:MFS family permease